MPTYLLVAQILVSAALIATVLFQLRGGGIGVSSGKPTRCIALGEG
ncbi:MAG: hypothetical protein OEV56_06370 [Dehalococcoidia bacterium]|nr:hypothetical protein [Dehalococcoidia bacterium]